MIESWTTGNGVGTREKLLSSDVVEIPSAVGTSSTVSDII